MEKNAHGVGAAALAPWETLFPAMNRGGRAETFGRSLSFQSRRRSSGIEQAETETKECL